MPHALLVDDDHESLDLLSEWVGNEGFTTASAGDLAEAGELLLAKAPDLIITDLMLPDGQGLDLLAQIEPPLDPQFVLITGHASVATAVEALRLGFSDYLTKPVDLDRLRAVLSRVAREHELRWQVNSLRSELRQLGRFGKLIGSSEAMNTLYDVIARVAPTDATVLISGESGVGKELVAQTLHGLSRRANGPFVAVNCGAMSPTLVESQLFGHEKGSFTGAETAHRGYFEQAAAGTLFLDEITEMPSELQVKLLRALEGREVTPLGGEAPMAVDVRVIAATNRNLETAVTEGTFREDLMYRLSVFELEIPPLRERAADIQTLAEFFITQAPGRAEKTLTLSPAALDVLNNYTWPGNIRELSNAIQRAAILSDGEVLPEHLPNRVSDTSNGNGRDSASGKTNRDLLKVPIGLSIADAERLIILATLDHCSGEKPRAADILGVSLKTLYNRLNTYSSNVSGGVGEGVKGE